MKERSSPYPHFLWWAIPNQLAGMPRPALDDLSQLVQSKISGIISVMDEPSGINEYKAVGLSALWLPITGGKAPSIEQVQSAVNFIDPILAKGEAAVIHCTSGNRRTGTLIAAYLIAKGEVPTIAIERIYKARPTAELREVQRQFLLNLPEALS